MPLHEDENKTSICDSEAEAAKPEGGVKLNVYSPSPTEVLDKGNIIVGNKESITVYNSEMAECEDGNKSTDV